MSNVEIAAGYREARATGNAADKKRFQTLIIEKNQGLVRKLVHRFVHSKNESELEDAMQAGSMGLLRALEDYEPERSSFSTYAAHWIRDHVQRWGGRSTDIKRPRSAMMPAKVAKDAAQFRLRYGKEPTPADLGVTDAQWSEWASDALYVYLDREQANAADDVNGPRFEVTADVDAAAHVIDLMALEAVWDEAVRGLSDRNIDIAEAVFWQGETMVSVAERFGFSQGFVSQICARVEERLRRAVANAAEGPPSSQRRHELVQKHLARVKSHREKGQA